LELPAFFGIGSPKEAEEARSIGSEVEVSGRATPLRNEAPVVDLESPRAASLTVVDLKHEGNLYVLCCCGLE
tara:strand:+ start:3104 stop:3319 length:216 start_codon:yes stop_codon:yes gene_type:complete